MADDTDPDPKEYVVCKACTKKNESGRPVYIHRLHQKTGFFSTGRQCPLGHKLEDQSA